MFDILGSLLMQAATTSGNAALDSAIAIIVSVGVIAGIAAPYLKRLNGRMKVVGQYADTFAQKTAEQEENFYRFGKAARTAVPELDAELKKYEVTLANGEKRIVGAADQLEYFRDKTPADFHASNVSELPRESDVVQIRKRRSSLSEEAV